MKGSVLYRVIPFVAALLLLSLPAAAQTRITFATRVGGRCIPRSSPASTKPTPTSRST